MGYYQPMMSVQFRVLLNESDGELFLRTEISAADRHYRVVKCFPEYLRMAIPDILQVVICYPEITHFGAQRYKKYFICANKPSFFV